jgi:hypothetical protein
MSPRDDDLQRTRDGDLVERPDHDCDDGWTHDTHDRPRPCPTCRPDTHERLHAQRQRAALDWLPLEALRTRPTDQPPPPDPQPTDDQPTDTTGR